MREVQPPFFRRPASRLRVDDLKIKVNKNLPKNIEKLLDKIYYIWYNIGTKDGGTI